jgi:hypothetical protein
VFSYWTLLVVGIVLLGVHICWFVRTSINQRPEAVSGFGAVLVLFGIVLAARPFLRKGFRAGIAEMTGKAMPPQYGMFVTDEKYDADHEAKRPQVQADVIAERVVGVVLITVGTILSGWAGLWTRLLEMALCSR